MHLQHLIDFAISPALSLLPERMDTPEARRMLVAIALQESRAQHRHQIGGPAHSYWQGEAGGGLVLVHTHPATQSYATALRDALDIPLADVFTALEWNDPLAAGCARLLLWTLPEALPRDQDEGWRQYVRAWRPGKPHPGTWAECWAQAGQAVAA